MIWLCYLTKIKPHLENATMKKIALSVALFLFSNYSVAAFNGLSHHSRANCINNETISWDFTRKWNMGTAAEHFHNNDLICVLTQNYEDTRRAAVVHWGEGRGGWRVKGYHWLKDGRGQNHLVLTTEVTDCSIYNGWWDFNP